MRVVNIPKDQPLAATEYVAKRRQMALDRGLEHKLAAARAAKKAKQPCFPRDSIISKKVVKNFRPRGC